MGGGTKHGGGPGPDPSDDVVDLIGSGRVTLLFTDGDSVTAMCRTDEGVLDLGFDRARGWWCSCQQPDCVHVRALRMFSETPGGAADLRRFASARPAAPSTPPPPAPPASPAPEPPPRRVEPPARDHTVVDVPPPEPAPAAPAERAAMRPSEPPPPPTDGDPRPSHWGRWAVLALGLAIVIGAPIVWRASRPGSPGTVAVGATASPSPTAVTSPTVPSPSPSPSPTPTTAPPKRPQRPHDAAARFPLTVRMKPLFVSVVKFDPGASRCVEHLLAGTGAYLTGCPQWQWPGAPPIALFRFTLLNKGDEPLDAARRTVRMIDGDGTVHRALDMTPWALTPEMFIPEAMHLVPGQQAAGWLAFDWSSPFVPRRLELPRKGYTITIRFVGAYS